MNYEEFCDRLSLILKSDRANSLSDILTELPNQPNYQRFKLTVQDWLDRLVEEGEIRREELAGNRYYYPKCIKP